MVADSIVDARRASIVAFYGGLPDPLATVVGRLQGDAADRLGAAFVARPPATLHATLIGLEFPTPEQNGADHSRYDVRPLAAHLMRLLRERPLQLRFGGARPDDLRWPSQGTSRYERSFRAGPSHVVVLGWPVAADGAVLPALAEIRRGCEPWGVRHRYHDRPGAVDGDAYLALGDISGPLPAEAATGLADAARRELAAAPVQVRLGPEQLGLVEYTDSRLPSASTRHRPLLGF